MIIAIISLRKREREKAFARASVGVYTDTLCWLSIAVELWVFSEGFRVQRKQKHIKEIKSYPLRFKKYKCNKSTGWHLLTVIDEKTWKRIFGDDRREHPEENQKLYWRLAPFSPSAPVKLLELQPARHTLAADQLCRARGLKILMCLWQTGSSLGIISKVDIIIIKSQ